MKSAKTLSDNVGFLILFMSKDIIGILHDRLIATTMSTNVSFYGFKVHPSSKHLNNQ